jgi:hypothetical protein
MVKLHTTEHDMGANAKQKGRRVSLAKPDLWYFDQLPPTARQALANANFSWSAGHYLNRWKRGEKGFKSGREIAERVRDADRSVKDIYRQGTRIP